MKVFDLSNIISNGNLLSIDSILMRFMKVPFLSQLFPSALCLFRHHLCFLQLQAHLLDFLLQTVVLVLHVRYQTYLVVVECAFLLQFVPLLLKHTHSFRHSKSHEEVSDKVINNHISLNNFRLRLLFERFHRVSLHALALLSVGSLCLKHIEVIQIVVIVAL